MSRFEGRWREWDAAVARGESTADVLRSTHDDTLVQLLAGGDIARRRYEMDIIANEVLNRLRRTRHGLHQAARAAETGIDHVDKAAKKALLAVQESEAAIVNHIEIRKDRVAGEPQAAEAAVKAATDTAKSVSRAVDAKEKIIALDQAVRRNAPTIED